jgi:hypothetical protein
MMLVSQLQAIQRFAFGAAPRKGNQIERLLARRIAPPDFACCQLITTLYVIVPEPPEETVPRVMAIVAPVSVTTVATSGGAKLTFEKSPAGAAGKVQVIRWSFPRPFRPGEE